jgi:hypothetical protein
VLDARLEEIPFANILIHHHLLILGLGLGPDTGKKNSLGPEGEYLHSRAVRLHGLHALYSFFFVCSTFDFKVGFCKKRSNQGITLLRGV